MLHVFWFTAGSFSAKLMLQRVWLRGGAVVIVFQSCAPKASSIAVCMAVETACDCWAHGRAQRAWWFLFNCMNTLYTASTQTHRHVFQLPCH
jgi:hypothetical protein